MPRRRGDGPGHARARRRAQQAAIRGLVADAVTEAQQAHAAAQHDPAGIARDFLSEAALPAVCALNRAGAPTLLPAMHRIVDAIRPGLISPQAALYGRWMEWHTSNRSGRPLSMGDTMRLTGAGSAMSIHSSGPALLHALRTRYPGNTAPYLNQARATYPGGVSELDAAPHLLHPPDRDLEVGEIMVFVEGADEAPTPPPARPTRCTTTPGRPPRTLSCTRCCPGSPPGAPPSRRRRTHPVDGPTRTCPPPLSRTRGAHNRGQVLWQERPGTRLLLLVVATRGDPERVLGITPTHLYGAAPVPRPPLPAPAAQDGVHTFLQTQEVTAVTRVHLVRPPSAPPDDPRGPRALSPPQTGSCGATCRTRGSPACRPNANGWPTAPARTGLTPPPPPPPLPPSPLRTTAQHRPRRNTDAPGGSGEGAPAATHAHQNNSDVGLR